MADKAIRTGLEVVDLSADAQLPSADVMRLRPHVGVWSSEELRTGRALPVGAEGLSVILAPADGLAAHRVDPAVAPMVVAVPDVDGTLEVLRGVVDAHPTAMTVLHHVLVAGERQATDVAFALESLAYSTLMAGPEYSQWLSKRSPEGTPPEASKDQVDVDASPDGRTLLITLDRAERKNAFGRVMRAQLLEALSVLDHTEDMRAEIRGAGSVFCSGGDLSEFGTAPDAATAHLIRTEHHVGRIIDRHHDRVAVHAHGACIGAGVELPALAGRFVAAPDTWFCLPEVGMGLIPGAGGTVSVARRIGRWRAMYMAATGARIDTRTALKWGLIDAVVDT